MYEDYTIDVEGGLADNTEDDEDLDIATGLFREVPKPEANDNYVTTLVMLSIGNNYARGKVIGRERDVYGNVIGW